mgnify:FL=1
MVAIELTETLSVGLSRPAFLVAFPIAVAAVWALLYRGASGAASARSRRWLLLARVVVVALVALSAAGR